MAIMPALILWYLSTSEVKAAFGERSQPTIDGRDRGARARRGAGRRSRRRSVAAARWPQTAAPERRAREPAPVVAADGHAGAGRCTSRRRVGIGRRARDAHHMRIEDVEGIGPAYAAKLAAVGVRTTDDLLTAGAKPEWTARSSPRTRGSAASSSCEWVNNVDLMRVPGVGPPVQRPARGGRRRLARRACPAQPGEPRDHGPGGRRRATGRRPPMKMIDSAIADARTLGCTQFTVIGHSLIDGMTREAMLAGYTTGLMRIAPVLEAADMTALVEPFNPVNHLNHLLNGSQPACHDPRHQLAARQTAVGLLSHAARRGRSDR